MTEEFDWNDFMDDTNELSLAAVGGWIKCLHKMRKSVTRGRISMPIEGYARMFGSTVDQAKRVIDELLAFKTASSEEEGSEKITIINRRMYRNHQSQKSHENGQFQPRSVSDSPKLKETRHIDSSSSLRKKESEEERKKDILSSFAFWQKTLDHEQAKLTVERRRLINARLEEGYTPDDLKRAISGCFRSAYHMGKNEQSKVYDDITLICRSGSKVEQFIGYLRDTVGESTAKESDPPNCADCNDLGTVFVKAHDAEFEWQLEEQPCPYCATVPA